MPTPPPSPFPEGGVAFSAGGEVARLITERDWSRSPLGEPATWPASLVNAVALMLPAQAEIVLFWGPDYVALYNDAYTPTIGDKHPRALGRPAVENWSELWADLKPLLDGVRTTGQTYSAKDRPFQIDRRGMIEDVFFDISYSAVPAEDGAVGGVLCIVSETTGRVHAQRQAVAERERLARMFEQAPGFMALLEGPDHVYVLTNAAYQTLVGHRRVLGKTVREALPDLEGQGFFELLDHVYATGESHTGRAVPVAFHTADGETVDERLLDFIYQPVNGPDGHTSGIFVEGTDVTEQMRAQAEQRATEERLRLATRAAAIGTWDFDPVSGRLDWDLRCRELFGLAADAQVNYEESFLGGIHPEDRERADEAVRLAITPPVPRGYDIEFRTIGIEDGIERWVAATGRALMENHQVVRFTGTVIDITERKRVEAALREETNALEILNRTAGRIAAELDLDRLVQTVVDAGVELSGAAFGAFFYNVIDGSGERYMLYALAGAPREAFDRFPMPRNTALFEPTFRGESIVRSHDVLTDERYGRSAPHFGMPAGHLPVRSYMTVPVVSRSGEVIGSLFFGHGEPGIFTDRGERLVKGLAAQAAVAIDNARLLQASQRLNLSLEQQVAERTADRNRMWRLSGDIMLVARFDGTITATNPAWATTFGWHEEDLVGRNFLEFVHPEDAASTRREVATLAVGKPTFHFDNRYRSRDGSYRMVSWTAVPGDDLIHAVGRDVTEEREAARALRETEERLRQSQKMESVGQLTGGIAHDFNNLLQIVTGNLELLLRNLTADTPRLRRAAENAMTGARRAATLTQRLLAFSRRAPLAPKPVDPNRLVPGMSELLHRTLGETIEIETVLAAGLWRVEADQNQLESAILNLALNARDAMPDGGKLTIETFNTHLDRDYVARHAEVNPGQYAVISVSDTGAGMDDDTLQRVFEPFFTTKEVGKGTGLGLSMVYGFVKQSGGHIKIYSELRHGTTVKIYLPRLMGAEEDEEQGGVLLVPEGTRDETILVCEDDDDVRAHSVDVLRELGYRVLEAHDGPSALRLLERQDGRVDLLFTDVVLPSSMTGAVLAEKARAMRPDIKVLFTTGYARNAIVHHGRLDPGVELITKPFSFSDLAARVRDILDQG